MNCMKLAPIKILTSQHAYEILKKHMVQDVEELWCLALGPALDLIAIKMIFRGTVDSCFVHPRDIFRFACIKNASQLLVAHNHPSGDPYPSHQDLHLTQRLVKIGQLIEIPIVDHLILTIQSYYSIAETNQNLFVTGQSL